jgi:hypothetical protein
MKLIIAGSRTLTVTDTMISDICDLFSISNSLEVVSGKANGIDSCGESFAIACGYNIKEFPADWDKNGKAAGPIRNKEMAEYADALLLIWDGESRGSKNMKETMNKLNKPVFEVILRKYST